MMMLDIINYIFYLIIFIVTFLYGFFTHKYNYWTRRGIPYVEPRIPFGNLQGFKRTMHSSQQMKGYYDKEKGKFPFIGMYFFTSPFVLVLDLNLVKNILIKDFQFFADRGVFYNEKDDPLSAHLFALDGQRWKNLRHKLTPTFTSGKMKFMFPTIVKVGEEFQQTLRELTHDNDILEIKDVLARFTTDVIGTCAFGIDCNSLKDPNAEFRRMGKTVFENPKNSAMKQIFIFTFKNLALKLRMTTTRDDVSKFFLGVVKQTMEYRLKNNVKRNDFMDLLIQLSKTGKLDDGLDDNKKEQLDDNVDHLTFEEIAAQAFVFFLAGFETSSTTMGYTLHELALNQEIQDKLRDEINSVIEKHDGKFTYDAMMEMTYLDQVINESLRKYPPGANIIRKTNNDYLVPETDKIIEKGISTWIPVYAIHHDPEIYPEPSKFDPDRFTSENIQSRPHCSFLPFGDGPRNCIGLRFGMMQARVGIVSLLKNFRFKTCDKSSNPLEFSTKNVILTPVSGIWVQVEKL